MSPTCPKCNATVHETDRYCPSCGASLSGVTWSQSDYVPLPGVTGNGDTRSRWKRRRPWYRRPIFVTLALVMAVLAIGAAAAAYYIQQRFEEINTISTPPPVVSGAVFADEDEAGNPDVQVDTSPAQRALELAESGQIGEIVLFESDAAGANPVGTPATPASPFGATPVGDGTGGFEIVDLTGTPRATAAVATPEPDPTRPASFILRPVRESEGSTLNVLLMGVDAREGQPIDGEVRPDSLSVLHVDGETGACRLLAIPRDTRTELPGYGLTKINHALALGGVPYEMLVVEQLLGIEIDHFGLIDFGGVEGLVNAVGGVTVTNERAFEAGGFTFAEGEIALDGEQALAYSRFRYDERGDFGRQERQQQVIRALLAQTSGLDVATNAPRLLDAVEGHFKSDLSAREMISLATEFRDDCTPGTLETGRMDGAIETHQDPLLNLPLSYVVVDEAEIASRVAWLLGEDGAGAEGTPVATP
jgi:polyisoprenyl-teichoic acid--peptidoglycan teichoic acid transferase